MEIPETDPPTAVELDRTTGLTLRWSDGSSSHFLLGDLRRNCPCAECRGLREEGRVPGPGPHAATPLTALGAELVGSWGVTIRWSDGHETGIYPWGLLRAWDGS